MSGSPFTLFTTPLSANGRKVLALCRHLGLEGEIRTVNVYAGEGRSPEYLAVNPSGKIPALVEDDFTLTESNAILLYLADTRGEGALLPGDARGRADVARWLFWESAHWQPALVPVLQGFVGHALLPDALPAPQGPPDWKDPTLAPLLAFLESHLGDHDWLAGGATSLADLSVAGMVTYFRAARFPFDDWPAFADWYGRIEALPAWRETEDPLWSAG